jgi:hypothetical protein
VNEPRRLSKSGGVSQRLLASASIDKPSEASRVRANTLAATASSFARTHSGGAEVGAARRKPNPARTLATWVLVGAAASVSLALIGSRWLDSSTPSSAAGGLASPAMSVFAEPAPLPSIVPAPLPEISPEPPAPANAAPRLVPLPSHSIEPGGAAGVEPWVPSPVAAASAAPAGAPRRSAAAFDEAREIEAARVAVSRGEESDAIAKLDDYDQTHPNGQLKPESMALRIQALKNGGKASEARTLADQFRGKYPEHPLVQQVLRNVAK